MKNKTAKQKLIQLYGAECFIEKLHVRVDTEPRKYTSKGQYKRMKQLTYHHIREKQHGGKSTVEKFTFYYIYINTLNIHTIYSRIK